MYELLIYINDILTHQGVYDDLDDLQNYIYYLEKFHRKEKNNRIYKIQSKLLNEKILVSFD